MTSKKQRLFYVIVVDDDRKLFNVTGPVADDTPWIDVVVAAQKKGRRVNCHTAEAPASREALAAEYSQQFGHTFVEEPVA